MKLTKKLAILATAALLSTAVLAGCGGTADEPAAPEASAAQASEGATAETTLLKVGVCAGPYSDLFKEAIQPSLEAKGYAVEIKEFSDYVLPNNALGDGEINLNVYQHSTYLKNFSKEHNLDLTYITEIPTAAMGVFSNKYDSLDAIEDGATVAIPNDDTNLSRALLVLQQAGVITLKSDIDTTKATVNDIESNPKNLKFTEVSAEVLPTVLDSTGLAVINGNYAIGAGLNLADALYNEKIADGYFNVIAVQTKDADSQWAKDIKEIVHSDAFRKVVEKEGGQYVAFDRPADYEE